VFNIVILRTWFGTRFHDSLISFRKRIDHRCHLVSEDVAPYAPLLGRFLVNVVACAVVRGTLNDGFVNLVFDFDGEQHAS
jgi:hypothetical protein